MNKKIKEAIAEGKLIPFGKVMESFSKKERVEIKKRTRYIMAAMEVRKLRRRLKLTQANLARKMKVKRELISRIESGRQNVTLETLYRIAEVAGKEINFQFK